MKPLAERMRPNHLNSFVGQQHLVGPGSVLRKSIESGNIPSMIFWGPPGVGKTTLANIIAHQMNRPYYSLSAINSGVKDIRETIEKAKKQQFFNRPNPILFIDEIHRFSKSQQDSLLGAVEKGIITLIGATTENPSFEVISALLSRCQVYILRPLLKEDLLALLKQAILTDEELKSKNITLDETEALLRFSGGDARKLYNALEITIYQHSQIDPLMINNEKVQQAIHENMVLYDKMGEQHYDLISAFIKSIRGSDPNATLYYLARMIEGGEDPKFICRRMIIASSEDIGLANPNALLLANSCMQAIQAIGMPEGRIIMAETAIYLANSPKSNSAYTGIKNAQELVRKTGNLSVPLQLRNAPTNLMKEIGYGKEYQYAHDFDGNFVKMNFLPLEIKQTILYEPGENIQESNMRKVLLERWKNIYNY